MNRITAAIARKNADIEQRLRDGIVTPEKVEETHKTLDMEWGEYARFEELKSLAVIQEKLTLDEGMTIYAYLGETLDTFNKQPIEVKAVLTGLFAELLKMRIDQRQTA